jgi:cytochrome P450
MDGAPSERIDPVADRLADPALYQHGDPWPVWRTLRAAGGTAWSRERDGPGFWSVTRHADAATVLADWQGFSSVPGTTLEGDRWSDDPAAGLMLPLMDPPLHGEVRRLVVGEFASRIAALTADRREEVDRAVAAAADGDEVDLDASLSVPLPLRLSIALLGVPTADAAGLLPIVRGTLSCDKAERAIADAELVLYLQDLIDARRRRPGEDLISRLCGAGVALPEEALTFTVANLLSAGLTTTRLAINGAFEVFARQPETWSILRLEPSRRRPAVEEILRWTSPALAVVRTATRPVRLGEATAAAGERVVIWLPAANRDEAAFDEADRFRIDRAANPHLAFGSGIHRCLGAALTRAALALVLEATTRRWGDIALAAEPVRLRSLVLQGVDQLRLVVRPD